MNWLFPTFFLAAGAALLPVILHLLRKRRKRSVAFPSLKFLDLVSETEQRWHRIKRWLVLLLRCAVFALLAAAFARPCLPAAATGMTRATVIVLDNSFSMQATGLWPGLREWTLGVLKKTVPEETVGVLLMNPKPNWLVVPTRDVQSVLQTIERFKPGWYGTQAMPALRFAGDMLSASSADERRIVMVTDRQACGWLNADFTTKLPAGITLVFAPELPPLHAQSALWTPAVSREGDRLTVSVPVKTYVGSMTRTINAFAGSQMIPFASKTVQLVPGSLQTVVLSGVFPVTENWIRCEASAADDELPADDIVYALVPEAQRSRVVLLDPVPADCPTDYLSTACETLSSVPPSWKTSSTSTADWPEGAVLFLRNDASFAGAAGDRLDTFLNAGGAAVFFATGGPEQEHWLAKHRAPWVAQPGKVRLHDWAVEHPLVAPLAERSLRSLVGWRFLRGWSLPPDSIEPLAFWEDGTPAVGELTVGKGRVLVAGFMADRRDGDWPVEGSFLPFLHRSVQYLFDARGRAPQATAMVGVPLALPEGMGHWTPLAGPAVGAPAREARGYVMPAAPGVYEWIAELGVRHLFAVGLSHEESDPAPVQGLPWQGLVSPEKVTAKVHVRNIALAAEEAESQQKLWWWCLVIVVVCLLFEMGLSNRTVR